MGGGQTATTQQTNKVELPAWVDQASQENYQFAKDVAGRPLQQYGGQQVADPSDMTTQGYGLLKALPGQPSGVTDIGTVGPESISSYTDPYYKQAADLFSKSAGPLDINSFLNPYTQEVENRAVGNATTALQKQLLGVSDASRKAGAFGGSRAAIESGVTRAEGARGIGDLTAQLRSQGFDVASNLATQAQAGQRAAGTGLLSTGQAVGGSRQANQASLIAQQQQQMARQKQQQDVDLANISALLGAGGQEQAQRQAQINAAMKQFYEARDYPVEQLNTRLAALGMSPYGKTETGSKTATQESSPDFATIGLGLGKMLFPGGFALSDRDMKTDIEKLGKYVGLDMYAYRYKGDPKSYPKVVGPMAQDVEKKFPKAVKKVGGKRVIDIGNLMEALS